MSKRRIIETPYRNAFSGPEFAIGTGPFMEITKGCFQKLFFEYISHDKLWISTNKCYNFICMENVDAFYIYSYPDLDNYLNTFIYYSCNRECGLTISFWIDIGDISYSEYLKLKSEYLSKKKLNYTTFVKQYLKLPKNDILVSTENREDNSQDHD